MDQVELLEPEAKQKNRFDLEYGYELYLPHGPGSRGDLYYRGGFVKRVNLADKSERRIFVVEMLQKKIRPSLLADVLVISRQTVHNYRESYRKFGVTGLLHGYSPTGSTSRELQARLHVDSRRPGIKARELEELRRIEKAGALTKEQNELAWDGVVAAIYVLDEAPIKEVSLSAPEQPVTEQILNDEIQAIVNKEELYTESRLAEELPPTEKVVPQTIDLPFADNHGWIASRYSGIFTVLMVLVSQQGWMQRLFGLFGNNSWRIFNVFVLMVTRDLRSMEQLKNVIREEAGRILGLGRLPSLDTLWGWFHEVADKACAKRLLQGFFAQQLRCGLVGARLWFIDGHLLPYTGQEKVHQAFSTQRAMPMPGQTNMVTCDDRGRIVYFDIQEGHGNLRSHILKMGEYARQQALGTMPVLVFDREGDGAEFFGELVASKTPFVTWEKNACQAKLQALQPADFTASVRVRGKDYQLLEQIKTYGYQEKDIPNTPSVNSGEAQLPPCFKLRRVVLWNKHADRRSSVLCWDGELGLTQEEIATAMLTRWGASENTFKHIQDRHPFHYHPGFGTSASEKQDIANPEIRRQDAKISNLQKGLSKLYKKFSKAKQVLNKDGSERTNSLYGRIQKAITENETNLKQLKSDKATLPERVDVAGLADYRSFKAIDNEGKNLFDFVTASVWNARDQLLGWLKEGYARDNERVDLLYAIFDCHGWIRSDKDKVIVRLEPLQLPSRRSAQEHLCRRLNRLGARIPCGKWLLIEVGESPLR